MTEENFYKILGQKLIQHRQEKKLTQLQLAKAANFNRSSISNIEQGRQKILLYTLYEFANTLGTTVSNLLPNEKDFAKAVEESSEAGYVIPSCLPEKEKNYINSFLNNE